MKIPYPERDSIEKLQYVALMCVFILNIGILSAVLYETHQGSVRRDIIVKNQNTSLANQTTLENNQATLVCILKETSKTQIISESAINACIAQSNE